MVELPRLNGIICALENGGTAMTTFAPPDVETAIALSASKYDGVVFEMEHGPYDIRGLRDALQHMLNRRQLIERGTLAPAVTPTVRIPPNGGEQNQWIAKQVLDSGVYGVVWPHVSTVEDAYNAVAACRYPRPKGSPNYEPEGQRGDAPGAAARYWGLTQQEYYARADVWPLNPAGEILVIIMCEEVRAIDELPRILEEVSGIGVVLIGEGDLSQNLGFPRQYEHPAVVEAMTAILRTCKEHGVPCGHPHVDRSNVGHLVEQGYRYLMPSPTRSYAGLEEGLRLIGRAK
jgi:4-hydroxy-2-oxoheptanedioate aldolase